MLKKLSDTKVGDKVIVDKITTNDSIKRRLLDLGLIPGTRIENVLKSPMGEINAYNIRGSLIAIRLEDASNIIVEAI